MLPGGRPRRPGRRRTAHQPRLAGAGRPWQRSAVCAGWVLAACSPGQQLAEVLQQPAAAQQAAAAGQESPAGRPRAGGSTAAGSFRLVQGSPV